MWKDWWEEEEEGIGGEGDWEGRGGVWIDTSDCNVSDLVITGYTIGETHYDYDGNDISNDILLTDTDKTVSIRFDVEWNDGTGENMNNAQDTEASKEGSAAFDINVNFIQKR